MQTRAFASPPEFSYADIFAPAKPKDTPYKKLTSDFVSTFEVEGKEILKASPAAVWGRLTQQGRREFAIRVRHGQGDQAEASQSEQIPAL